MRMGIALDTLRAYIALLTNSMRYCEEELVKNSVAEVSRYM